MEYTFTFHGTPKLKAVLAAGSIQCPSLQLGDELYAHHSAQHDALTMKLAGLFMQQPRKVRKSYTHQLEMTNKSESTLADIVSMDPAAFKAQAEDVLQYKELRRSVHVFMAQYACAENYAKGADKAVLEVIVPESIVASRINGGWVLVKKEVGLDLVPRIMTPRYNVKRMQKAFDKKGYNIEISEIPEPPRRTMAISYL